jgi:hypothetical protein
MLQILKTITALASMADDPDLQPFAVAFFGIMLE